jgi:hypothetical protein
MRLQPAWIRPSRPPVRYLDSVTYRFHVAAVAVDASDAVAPCTRLHAGSTVIAQPARTQSGRRVASSRISGLADRRSGWCTCRGPRPKSYAFFALDEYERNQKTLLEWEMSRCCHCPFQCLPCVSISGTFLRITAQVALVEPMSVDEIPTVRLDEDLVNIFVYQGVCGPGGATKANTSFT